MTVTAESNDRGLFGRDFDELAPGDSYESKQCEATQRDVAVFAGLTGDSHPIHVDPEWAASGPFGRPIAHGLLVLSLAVGALPLDPDRVIALRSLRDVVFKRPVVVGESFRVRCSVAGLREVDSERGLVDCEWRIESPDGRLRTKARVEIIWRRGFCAYPDASESSDLHRAAEPSETPPAKSGQVLI